MRWGSTILILVWALGAASGAEAQFCGEGDGDWQPKPPVAEAWELLQEGLPEIAKEVLMSALQEGRVPAHERPEALLTLAEAQLRTGEWPQAVHNYRRGMQLSGQQDPGARLGLAFALFLGRRDRAAQELAQGVVAEVCAAPGGLREPICYGAHRLLARVAPSRASRLSSRALLARIREARLVPWTARRGYDWLLRDILEARGRLAAAPSEPTEAVDA